MYVCMYAVRYGMAVCIYVCMLSGAEWLYVCTYFGFSCNWVFMTLDSNL